MSNLDYTDILINLRKIIRSINLESKRIEKSYGVSIPQLLTLNYLLNKEEHHATSTEIKNFLNLNASTVTGIIARLEKKNLVARLPKRQDKRVTYIAITSKGAELVDKIPPLMHERLSAKLKDLPNKKLEEIKQAIELLVDFMGIEAIEAAAMLTLADPLINTDDKSEESSAAS